MTPPMTPSSHDEMEYDIILKPPKGAFLLSLRELLDYRDLILLFVKRDFVTFYKQTILGPLWFIIQPLFTSFVFMVIFSNFAKIPTDGVPPFLFYLAGNITWMYFSTCLQTVSTTFLSNSGMFGKVYFPRLTVPISVVISKLFQFAVQFTLFATFYCYFLFTEANLHPNSGILLLPLLLLQMALLGMGVGLIVSSLTIKYRDLQFVLGFGLQLWMYGTPVVYPLSQVPERFLMAYSMNPMVSIVESLKQGFFGGNILELWQVGLSWGITLLLLLVGLLLFSRMERNFMDTI